jgi:FkbM family methyltransferase
VLGGRSWELVRRNVLAAPNWVALARAWRVYAEPVEALRRYVTGRGAYPWRPSLRTPLGLVAPLLHSHHDLVTVHEVFCREDYPAPPPAGAVVDVGSNIGISALWFLTREPAVRVRCFEPVPTNVARLADNLAPFAGRWSVEEVAVDATGGEVEFGVEPTGRYGGIDVATGRTVRVRCRAIAEILDEAGPVDVLKVDTEGAELRTVAAIRPDQLARIGRVAYEWLGPEPPPHGDAVVARRSCDTVTLAPAARP